MSELVEATSGTCRSERAFQGAPSALAEAGRVGWERLPALRCCLLALLQLLELRNLFGPACSPAPEAVGLLELTSSMSCRRFSPQKAEQEVSKMLGSVGSTGFGGGSGLPVCISLCCLGKREASLYIEESWSHAYYSLCLGTQELYIDCLRRRFLYLFVCLRS